MLNINRRQFSLGLSAMPLFGNTSQAFAQAYPSQPIKLVVGFAPGGLTDILARMIGQSMSEQLGKPVIVENKPGANGNISTAFVAAAAPDGHTLLLSSAAQIVYSPHTYRNMTVDPINGLRHVSMVGEGDFIFVVNSDVGVDTLAQFIALAKSKPGKLNYASGGVGGTLHVIQEMFCQKVGIQMTGVHYRGTSAAIPEVLSNQIQLFCDGLPSLDPHLKSGKLKPLFVSSAKRMEALPNVHSSTEVNLKEFSELSNWFGIHAPKGTPDATVAKIQTALSAAKASEAVRTKMRGAAIAPVFNGSAEFMAQIAVADKLIAQVTRAGNIRVE